MIAWRNWTPQLARGAVRQPQRASRFSGICIGLQMLFEHSEEGDAAGLGILPGRVQRFATDMVGADGQRLEGATYGLEPGCTEASATHCGLVSLTRRFSILCTATMWCRMMPVSSSAKPIMVTPSRRRWPETMFLPFSATLKRVREMVCSCYVIL